MDRAAHHRSFLLLQHSPWTAQLCIMCCSYYTIRDVCSKRLWKSAEAKLKKLWFASKAVRPTQTRSFHMQRALVWFIQLWETAFCLMCFIAICLHRLLSLKNDVLHVWLEMQALSGLFIYVLSLIIYLGQFIMLNHAYMWQTNEMFQLFIVIICIKS